MDCEYGGDVSGLECALSRMTEAVCGLLVGCRPSVYLYGSAVSGDFRLGWSDLDVLVLTREPIPPSAAEALGFSAADDDGRRAGQRLLSPV